VEHEKKVAMARLLSSGKIEHTMIQWLWHSYLAVAKSHAVTKSKRETKLGKNRKQKPNAVANEMKMKPRLKCCGRRNREIEREKSKDKIGR